MKQFIRKLIISLLAIIVMSFGGVITGIGLLCLISPMMIEVLIGVLVLLAGIAVILIGAFLCYDTWDS